MKLSPVEHGFSGPRNCHGFWNQSSKCDGCLGGYFSRTASRHGLRKKILAAQTIKMFHSKYCRAPRDCRNKWYQMISAPKNVKRSQFAYLFGGPWIKSHSDFANVRVIWTLQSLLHQRFLEGKESALQWCCIAWLMFQHNPCCTYLIEDKWS